MSCSLVYGDIFGTLNWAWILGVKCCLLIAVTVLIFAIFLYCTWRYMLTSCPMIGHIKGQDPSKLLDSLAIHFLPLGPFLVPEAIPVQDSSFRYLISWVCSGGDLWLLGTMCCLFVRFFCFLHGHCHLYWTQWWSHSCGHHLFCAGVSWCISTTSLRCLFLCFCLFVCFGRVLLLFVVWDSLLIAP